MEVAKTTGALTDLVETFAGACPSTCKAGAPSTRTIDFLLATEALLPEVRDAWVEEDCSYGFHMPLKAVFTHQRQDEVERVIIPAAMPAEAHMPLPWEAEIGYWGWPGALELHEAVQSRDPTRALEVWLQRWEELLVARAEQRGVEVPDGARGRADLRRRHTTKSEKIKPDDPLPESMQAMKSVMAKCQRMIQGKETDEDAVVDLRQQWEALECSVPPPPHSDALQDSYLCLARHFADLLRMRRGWRVQQWQEKIRDVRSGTSTTAFAYVKARTLRAVHAIKGKGGGVVVNAKDIFEELRLYWSPFWWLDDSCDDVRRMHAE
eukprot:2338572-Amphidinium_carterae.1